MYCATLSWCFTPAASNVLAMPFALALNSDHVLVRSPCVCAVTSGKRAAWNSYISAKFQPLSV
jgi:hypothetical protein